MLVPLLALAAMVHPESIRGDFDRDERLDTAQILRAGDGRLLLAIERAAEPERLHVIMRFRHEDRVYVRMAAQGRTRSACARGFAPASGTCNAATINIRGDVLEFGTEEASQAVAIWNGKSFKIRWISD